MCEKEHLKFKYHCLLDGPAQCFVQLSRTLVASTRPVGRIWPGTLFLPGSSAKLSLNY